ncbi:nuclease [Perilla frutescens var. frutescens]|nr:nuclease [Perilla frutescens var. frutescens]
MIVKPSTGIFAKIQESKRFNPFFKDYIGAIDGTHIPATVPGREVSSFRNRHGIQS